MNVGAPWAKTYPSRTDNVTFTVTRWAGSEGRWRACVWQDGALMADEFFGTREDGVTWAERKRVELLGKVAR
jgi:hypothetical protein